MAEENLALRTTTEVFEDHLRLAKAGDVEADLQRNYDPNCVVLSGRGIFHGHQGLRQLARMLAAELPDATFDYVTEQVWDRMAFLEWTGVGSGYRVRDGADSFLIEEGKIILQTIHYQVESA